MASGEGLENIVSILIDAGLDVNRFNGIHNVPPLVVAALEGRVAVVKLLLSRPEIIIDLQEANGGNALIFASIEGHVEVTNVLIAAGADPTIEHQYVVQQPNDPRKIQCSRLMEVR